MPLVTMRQLLDEAAAGSYGVAAVTRPDGAALPFGSSLSCVMVQGGP